MLHVLFISVCQCPHLTPHSWLAEGFGTGISTAFGAGRPKKLLVRNTPETHAECNVGKMS